MAKSHYSFKKRKKELARKLKQEQKRQRKFDKDSTKPENALEESQDNVKNPLPQRREFVFAESDRSNDVSCLTWSSSGKFIPDFVYFEFGVLVHTFVCVGGR